MFQGCSNLINVTLGDGITQIDEYAFYLCKSLSNITIPNGVTSIARYAFANCTALTNITIPSSVTTIGANTFSSCSNLASITSLRTTAPSISSNTFISVKTGGTLYVPTGSTGYDKWMGTGNYYLGKYNWTKVEQ
jgi:hypothetical protein